MTKNHQQRRPALFLIFILVPLFGALSACGGGGSEQQTNTPPPINTPPPDSGVPPNTTVLGRQLPGPRPQAQPQRYVNFETGQVRPVALSKDRQNLFVVNTPDNRLELFELETGLPVLVESVPVGMEPVAVAEAPNGFVWVVNHLSDSVSILDVSATPARIVQTLWVGDEPQDIVFASGRAFITTAHRGQNSPVDPALETPGVGRADVWIFDANNPGAHAGVAEDILVLFGDKPRALAVNGDGTKVYAAIFLSGNKTTTLPPAAFNKPGPNDSADGFEQPDTGLIVQFNGFNWVDEAGQTYDAQVPFSLPDWDVFEIDASQNPPAISNQFSGVGTTLFNISVNPVNDEIYVSNIEARNQIRFAGNGSRAGTTLRGHLTDNRVTMIRNGSVEPRLLNKHLDFSASSWTSQERDLSVSLPGQMAITDDGETLLVSAFGSSKIAVYDTQELRDDTFVSSLENQIEVTGGGPTGIVIDTLRNQAYVSTRFDNGLSVLDLSSLQETHHQLLFNPEPVEVLEGRKFLYDARITSGNGNDSCGSCHIFGNVDGLAWDLGDPDGQVSNIPNTFIPTSPPGSPIYFHPMKGPMTTQAIRGLTGHGPMHWRGDRTGVDRTNNETLEEAAFKEFNEAFVSLMGLSEQVSEEDMQAFTNFAMSITYPPNPIRALDNSLSATQQAGETLYNNGVVRIQTGNLEVCVDCHPIDPRRVQFGTAGLSSNNTQIGEKNFKIPHFRDQYQKVGMFGFGFNGDHAFGPQVRGFGFNHNGATTSNFIVADLGLPRDELNQLRSFLYAFPTESAPVLGQQVTLNSESGLLLDERILLLMERGQITDPIEECDLIAKGVVDNERRGWMMQKDGLFQSDRFGETLTGPQILQLATSGTNTLTFTCTPWGSGIRMGIDRDEDGVLDGD